ncbi:ABC transporter protein [Rutstroemia sp. NJR-2017a WRK4]|nr:ABC transporter protein [Rutstroemia sp. NJR-2017a WRK4]
MDTQSIVAEAIGLLVVTLFTLPSFVTIVRTPHKKKSTTTWGDSKDGETTPESEAAFSTTIPKACLCLCLIFGLLNFILRTIQLGDSEFSIEGAITGGIGWFLLMIQVFATCYTKDTIVSYNQGICIAISCIAFICMAVRQDENVFRGSWTFSTLFSSIQIVVLLATAISATSIPRRPAVFYNGTPVVNELNASFLSRYTLSSLGSLIALAKAKNDLSADDLPAMSYEMRSKDLRELWEETSGSGRLWVKLWNAYKWRLVLQVFLGITQTCFFLGPQFSMMNILRTIEGGGSGKDLAPWVMAFGLTTFLSLWLQTIQDLFSWTKVSLPMRAQLSALVFEKITRRKDVKTFAGTNEDAESTGEDDFDKTTQKLLNLLGVDVQRIADCASDLFSFIQAPFRLILAVVFLANVLDWRGVLLGISFVLVSSPATKYFSGKLLFYENALMQARDKKAAIMSEALQGARQIKFSAQEDRWERVIMAQREVELDCLWKLLLYRICLTGCWILNPLMTAAISLGVQAWLHDELTAAQAFTAIGVFLGLDHTMMRLPELVTKAIIARVSLQRLEASLDAPDLENILTQAHQTSSETDTPIISFDRATISWPSEEKHDASDDEIFALRDLNISFPLNRLSIICGRTGSGKSLLLHSILGEAELLGGSIMVPAAPVESYDNYATKDNWIIPNSIAYVSQIPWIENNTVQGNILFGLPMDKERYNNVIEACAMTTDLELLIDGDQTEIGVGGLNLSGGQRWRLTLARALYSRAAIILLDDIFSAVDVHVGQTILKNALVGKLSANRTCILATHHLRLCKDHVDSIIELENGTAKQFSSIEELEGYLGAARKRSIQAGEILPDAIVGDDILDDVDPDHVAVEEALEKKPPQEFVEEEYRKQGNVGVAVYLELLNACGGWVFGALLLLIYSGFTVSNICRSYWLRIWTDISNGSHDAEVNINSSQHQFYLMASPDKVPSNHGAAYYLAVYFALCITVSLVQIYGFYHVYVMSFRGAKSLFRRITFAVLRAPLRWIDTVPIGRIMNRFTSDFNISDTDIPGTVAWGLGDMYRVVTVTVVGMILTPYIVLIIAAMIALSAALAFYVLTASRAIRRLDSITRSDIFEQFRLIVVGIITIRAFRKEGTFMDRAYRKIDQWSSAMWHRELSHCWLVQRVGLIGAVYVTIVATIVALTVTDGGLAGFVLAISSEFTSALFWSLFHISSMEVRMNAIERILEYSDMKIETQEGMEPPASWPTSGSLEVKDLVVGYNHDLPPVLKELNFNIGNRERVGIVGRTGSGKSTLTLTLFRFLEARQGSIIIDGLDISKLKLQSLRRNLAIIPQDPVLFSGTIRSNLDSDNEHDDTVLYDALRRVHLISDSGTSTPSTTRSSSTSTLCSTSPSHKNKSLGLSSTVTEGGLNLSQGQRQLICLARAIIRRPKILVLDEATSSVDVETDALIQKSIREEFADSTLLVIAHRLSTVGDFDKIMVMADGKVVEFGSPGELIEERGVFWGMVEESGEVERLVEMSGR